MQQQIESDVAAIAGQVVAQLGERVHSIVWHGGFARGEGGLYRYHDRWLPFGDYDFEVVCDPVPTAAEQDAIAAGVTSELGYQRVTDDPTNTWRDDADRFNVLDIKYLTPAHFHARTADLAAWDFVHSSRVLYGADQRDQLNIQLSDLSPVSPFRILNNRLQALLPVGHSRLWRSDGTFQEYVGYELALVRVACDLSLCLSFTLGCYRTSYRERLAALAEHKKDLDRELGGGDELLAFIAAGVERKLHPEINTDGEAARRLWFDTLHHAWRVLQWMSWKLLLAPNTSVPRYADLLAARLPVVYYKAYLARELSPALRPLAPWLARLANAYENVRWQGYGFALRHPLQLWRSPAVRGCSVVPLVLYALRADGVVRDDWLTQAAQHLKVYGFSARAGSGLDHWDAVRAEAGALLTDYRARKGTGRTLRHR